MMAAVREREPAAVLVGDDALVPVGVVAGEEQPTGSAAWMPDGVHAPAGDVRAAGRDGTGE